MAAKKQTKKAESKYEKHIGKSIYMTFSEEEFEDSPFSGKNNYREMNPELITTSIQSSDIAEGDIIIEVEIKAFKKVIIKTEFSKA